MFWASSFVFDTVEEVDDSVSTVSELISEFSVDAMSECRSISNLLTESFFVVIFDVLTFKYHIV